MEAREEGAKVVGRAEAVTAVEARAGVAKEEEAWAEGMVAA